MRAKMQLLSRGVAGRHLCNNSARAVSLVLPFGSGERLFSPEIEFRFSFAHYKSIAGSVRASFPEVISEAIEDDSRNGRETLESV